VSEESRSRLIRLILEQSPGGSGEEANRKFAALPDLPADFEALLGIPGPAHSHGELSPFANIKTVIFDIYGTLFSSAAGDIAANTDYARGSLDALALELPGGLTGEELKDYFRRAVMKIHMEKYANTPYPEVRVEEIWAAFLAEHSIEDEEKTDPAEAAAELALRYELAANPVYPMEGALETLETLRDRGFRLGLISNAQFYTPLLFEAFFGASPEALGFDPESLIYSYELGEAKPSPALFAPVLQKLAGLGQNPETCLYVGNDMLNDIFAAAASGFKTLLFAGDRRSLRLREGNKLCGSTRPDGVIRRLANIPDILGRGIS
jgi:putative hydrolase of the HAD superfamily